MNEVSLKNYFFACLNGFHLPVLFPIPPSHFPSSHFPSHHPHHHISPPTSITFPRPWKGSCCWVKEALELFLSHLLSRKLGLNNHLWWGSGKGDYGGLFDHCRILRRRLRKPSWNLFTSWLLRLSPGMFFLCQVSVLYTRSIYAFTGDLKSPLDDDFDDDEGGGGGGFVSVWMGVFCLCFIWRVLSHLFRRGGRRGWWWWWERWRRWWRAQGNWRECKEMVFCRFFSTIFCLEMVLFFFTPFRVLFHPFSSHPPRPAAKRSLNANNSNPFSTLFFCNEVWPSSGFSCFFL